MSTASYVPSFAEWGVLNRLWQRAMSTTDRNASRVLNATNARPSDLGFLGELGYICADRDRAPIDFKEDDQWWTHGLKDVTLRLTAEGLNWCATNKLNIALHMVVEHVHADQKLRGMPLAKLTAEVGVDPVMRLAGLNLAIVRDADGEVVEAAKVTATKFAVFKTYVVHPSAKGRQLTP